jgi:hypothetical protein
MKQEAESLNPKVCCSNPKISALNPKAFTIYPRVANLAKSFYSLNH